MWFVRKALEVLTAGARATRLHNSGLNERVYRDHQELIVYPLWNRFASVTFYDANYISTSYISRKTRTTIVPWTATLTRLNVFRFGA
jgi:hypothetical protein